ncbi:MFS transporter, partial [Streptomyces sp. NPDC059524]
EHAAGARNAQLLQAQAMVNGYTHAIWWAVGILVVSATIAFSLINTGVPGSGPAAASGDTAEEADEVKIPVVAH